MTNKAFEIQESTIRIGGVDLQAGTTGVVIPGVTIATNYRVEEVEDSGDQTYSNFPPNTEITVIDKALYDTIVGQGNESGFADFITTTDDEGKIDEIDVNGQGTYSAANADRAGLNDMYAYVGTASATDRPLVPEDWIQVPFRPKMRAGEVENVGGGASLEDIQVTRDDDVGLTRLSLEDKDFEIRTTRSEPDPDIDADVVLEAADDVFITANGDDVVIAAADEIRLSTAYAGFGHEWTFDANGHMKFPDGSIQVTAYTGAGSDNLWIETFESDAPSTDFIQLATSVEYDAVGNIFALFSHSVPSDNNNTYTSVAKLTPEGAVLWQVRLGASLNTDGWGLAYYSTDNFVYVTGQTSGSPVPYGLPVLLKIQGDTGTVDWGKTYDFGANANASVVDVTLDGHPVMVGYGSGADNYIHTTKIDYADGSVLWSQKINGQGDEQAYGMAIGPNNEVVTIGYMDQLEYLVPINTILTITTSPASNINWTAPTTITVGSELTFDVSFADGVPTITNIVDTVGSRYIGQQVAQTVGSSVGGVDGVDDIYFYVDTMTQEDTTDKMLITKYLSSGDLDWQQAVQFDAGFDCSGADADIEFDGSIYVCGSYQKEYNGGTTSAMSLVKFDTDGVKQWSRRVVGDCDTFATSVVIGPDNFLYLSGITGVTGTSDYIWVVAKYDTFGTVMWQRLIDNTTAWTFTGGFFFGQGGGSNIAVRDGYVALAGGYGGPMNNSPIGTILQIDAEGTPFSIGDWDFKGASFSGIFNDSASDITVVDAGKTATEITGDIVVTDQDFSPNTGPFLTVTRLSLGAGSGNSIDNGSYSVSLGTDGSVTFPTLTVPISDNSNPSGTGQTIKFSDTTQQAIIYGPASTENNNSAQRVIIQGAPGYTGTGGEGGDIYLWAGPGGDTDGQGGDIKVRAGRGNGTGSGGYLNFQAGNSSSGYGGWINIESGSGASNQGGDIDIRANNGGQLNLSASQNANITLSTAGGSKQWVLSSTGDLTLPVGGDIKDSTGTSVLGNALAPELTKSQGNLFSTTNLEFAGESYGAIVDIDSGGNFNVWFNSTTGDSTGIMYSVGGNDNGYEFAYAFNLDGTVKWKVGFDNINGYDFNPIVVKCDNTDRVYVAGEYYNNTVGENQLAVVRLSTTDGSVESSWVMYNQVTAWFRPEDITFDGNNNPVVVGNSNNEQKTFTAVAAQAGSGIDLLIVNTSDLGGLVPQSNGGNWSIRTNPADPNSWFGSNDINWFYELPATALTGTATGVTIKVRYQQQDNGDWTWDYGYLVNTGNGEAVATDQFKVVGSAFGGTDGVDDILFTYYSFYDLNFTASPLVPSAVYNKTRFLMTQGVNFSQGAQNTTSLTVNTEYIASLGFLFSPTDGVGISGQLAMNFETGWTDTAARDALLAVLNNGDTFTVTFDGQPSPQLITLTSDFTEAIPGWRIATYTSGDVITGASIHPDTILYPNETYLPGVWDIRGDLGNQGFIWSLTGWQHTFGNQDSQYFRTVTYDAFDNRLYVAGDYYKTVDAVTQQAFVLTLNAADGATVWKTYYTDSVNGSGGATSIMHDGLGNVFLAGTSNNGLATVYKINNEGGIDWMTQQQDHSNWDNEPYAGLDSDGNIIVMGSRGTDNENVLSFMKIDKDDGGLIWARRLSNAQNYDMYDQYDYRSQMGGVVGTNIYFSSYAYDVNDNYYVAIATRLPTSGLGIGTHGRWIYADDTGANWTLNQDGITVNIDLDATDSATQLVDEVSMSTTVDNVGETTVTAHTLANGFGLVNAKQIEFADGTVMNTAFSGIKRYSTSQGSNTITLSLGQNGQFLHYNGTNGNSTIYVPTDSDVTLPIGYTVTIVMDSFDTNRIYINNGVGPATANINAVGFASNISNYWYIGGNGNVGVYTLMKVDTDRWILSGPEITNDN